MREAIVSALRELASALGPIAAGSEWHLFGSVDRDERHAADIDLMILCRTDRQADALRQAIDPDSLTRPLHLSFLTFDEATKVNAVQLQRSRLIFP
jgi:predicted nucleotidyltransferase